MALCNYEIHVQGTRQSALMFYATIKDLGQPKIINEYEVDQKYILWFAGKCADECDLYGKETMAAAIDNNMLSEDQIRNGRHVEEYFDLSLRQKSELLGVEILVRSWSKEHDYDQIEHYRNGYFIGVIGGSYDENNSLGFEF